MRGQVWIETVLYTLISLVLIGLVLSYAIPKLQAVQEKTIIDQTIASMRILDQTIKSAVELGSGNVRTYELALKRGIFEINPESDSIVFTLDDMSKPYSEMNVPINFGPVQLISLEDRGNIQAKLIMNYTNLNILTDKDELSLSGTPVPYQLRISYAVSNGEGSVSIIVV